MRRVVVLALLVGLAVAAGGWRGAAAQTEGQVPGNALGKTSDSDMWRAVRRGVGGIIFNPDTRPQPIIMAPYEDCAKAGLCTELAIGFLLPIHDDFPAIRTAQGKGLSDGAIGLLAVLFAGCLIGGGIFLWRLSGNDIHQA